MDGINFKKEILNQIRRYLNGEITKEEYYDIAEPFIVSMLIVVMMRYLKENFLILSQMPVLFILMSQV